MQYKEVKFLYYSAEEAGFSSGLMFFLISFSRAFSAFFFFFSISFLRFSYL
jgi:hypothetical protein